MVSTRAQSQGLHDGDALALRTKASPDVRILRDGTPHGPGTPDRPTKRRRTGRASVGAGASDIDDSVLRSDADSNIGTPINGKKSSKGVVQPEDTSQVPEPDKAQAEDTIVVSEPASEANTPTRSSKRKRAGKTASMLDDTHDTTDEPTPKSRHRRFGSEEPEFEPVPEEDVHTKNAVEEESTKEEEEEDDEAPEQVATTSSAQLQRLPSQLASKKSRSKRKKQTETTIPETSTDKSDTEIKENLQQPPTTGSAASPSLPPSTTSTSTVPSFSTALDDLNPPSTHHLPSNPLLPQPHSPNHSRQPPPPKPKKDIHIPSRNLTIKFLDDDQHHPRQPSSTTTLNKKRFSSSSPSLPSKVSSQSRNIREQLLRRGKTGSMTTTTTTKGKGFLVR